ncbi:MAG: phage major tail tube protein [Pseudomonadota bacterium]
MKETPAYILRNCALWVDRDVKVGQASEITVPALKIVTEDVRNAGMVRPRAVHLGYERPEFSFKFTAFDPATLKLVGLAPGVEKEFLATAALVDEDTTMHSASLYIRAMLSAATPDAWAPGNKVETQFEAMVNYHKLEIDGQHVLEMTDTDVIIGGVSQYSAIRAAMLL